MDNLITYTEKDYFERVDKLFDLSQNDNKNRELFTNLIIIDLITNIEVFIERMIKVFIKEFNRSEPVNKNIPDLIKIEQSKTILDDIQKKVIHFHNKDKTLELLREISNLWSEYDEHKVKLKYTAKYDKGKHGEVQIKKLFNKIDIEDILNLIEIPESDSMLNSNNLDIQNFISELTSKRNLAIHEGVPLQNSISLEELNNYILFSREIMKNINLILNEKLHDIINNNIN